MAHQDPYSGQTISGDWAYHNSVSGTYTPTLSATTTPPTLGTGGTALGVWHRNGHLITVWVQIVFGSSGTNAGSGTYTVSNPPDFPADASVYAASWQLGTMFLVDADTATNRDLVTVEYISTTTIRMRPNKLSGTLITHAVPFSWTANDNMFGKWSYLADPSSL